MSVSNRNRSLSPNRAEPAAAARFPVSRVTRQLTRITAHVPGFTSHTSNSAPPALHDFSSFQSTNYFNSLDGLRALSILLVLFHHVPALPAGHPLAQLKENGRFGVAFFFVISGFLICTLFLREIAKNGRVNLLAFYGRRILRLWPLYYAVLLVHVVLVLGLHQYTPDNQQLFRQYLPAYLFYYSNWVNITNQGPFFCAWSLAVEEQFYFLFGLLLFLQSSYAGRGRVVWLMAFLAVAKFVAYEAAGPLDTGSILWRILFSYREPILLGVLLALALDNPNLFAVLKRYAGSAWMKLAVLGVIAAGLACHRFQHESSWDSQTLYLCMALFVAAAVLRQRAVVLGGRLMTQIGKVSYGIYLLHMLVICFVKKVPWGNSAFACFVLSGALTLGLASLVYRYFESPIIHFYKRRFSPVARPEPAPTGAPRLAPIPVLPARNESLPGLSSAPP